MSETLPSAQVLDFESERDEQTESWKRAAVDAAETDQQDSPAEWTVRLPDSEDAHLTWLVEAQGGFIGLCTCDGYRYHGTPCAHLCVRRKAGVLGELPIPSASDVDTDSVTLAATDGAPDSPTATGSGDVQAVDAEVVDDVPDDVDEDQEDLDDDRDQDPTVSDVLEERDAPAPADVDDAGEFVEEISGVPQAFVVEMGRGESSSPYITKEGLNYIAHKKGLQTRSEPISPSWEEPEGMAAWRGIVENDEGGRWVDVGTAWLEHEDMQGAAANLDELASTRATNRALRLSTGAGFASIEELEGKAVVQEQTDDVQEGGDGE